MYVALLIAIGAAIWLSLLEGSKAPELHTAEETGNEGPNDPILRPQPQGALTIGTAEPTSAEAPVGASTPIATPSPWVKARLRVRVSHPEEQRYNRARALIYAIPADAPASFGEDQDLVVRAPWRKEVTTLDLPAAGSWHVGVTTRQGCTVQTLEVAAGTSTDVTLDLPRTESITVLLDPPAPAELLSYGRLEAHATGRVQGSPAQFPRPGQTTLPGSKALVADGRRAVLHGILPGIPYVVTLRFPNAHASAVHRVACREGVSPTFEAVPRRHRATAGDEVTFRIERHGYVEIQVPRSGIHDTKTGLFLYLVRGGRRVGLGWYGWNAKPGESFPRVAPPGTWQVEIQGPFRADGMPDQIEVRPGASVRLDVRAIHDPSRSAPLPASQRETRPDPPVRRVELVFPAAAKQAEHVQYVLAAHGPDAHGRRELWLDNGGTDPAQPYTAEIDGVHVERLYAAMLPWHAQRTTRRASAYRLHPVPAGYLVVVPEFPVPERLGALLVSARDGGLLPTGGFTDEGRAEFEGVSVRPIVHMGTTIGPLPAGTYELDVWLGGRRIDRVRAEVVARKIRPLVIPAPE